MVKTKEIARGIEMRRGQVSVKQLKSQRWEKDKWNNGWNFSNTDKKYQPEV